MTGSPRADMDRIFSTLLPRAREMLERNDGRFLPFGASLDLDGNLHAEAGAAGLPPDILVERMIERFRERSDVLRVCGITYDSSIVRGGTTLDAIATLLEHRDGETAVVYLLYRRVRALRFEYGGLVAADSPRRIFLNSDSTGP